MSAMRVLPVSSTTVEVRWEGPAPGGYTLALAAEAPVSRRDLPSGARLLSDRETHAGDGAVRIAGLAAGSRVYVCCRSADGVEAVGVTIPGGAGTPLAGPLRSVAALSPTTLVLRLTDEPRGAAWSVRRPDGRSLAVRRVDRRSAPVADRVEHEVAIELAEPVGGPVVLDVVARLGRQSLAWWLPWSDRHLEAACLQVNEVAYAPAARRRYAYVSGWRGDGGALLLAGFPATAEVVRDEPRGEAGGLVLAGLGLDPRRAADDAVGGEVRQIDLARVPADQTTRYRVRLPGVGVSAPFAVARGPLLDAVRPVAAGIAANRSWRPPGPHHDSGDLTVRVEHLDVPSLLLRAWELVPSLGLVDTRGLVALVEEAVAGVVGWMEWQRPDGSFPAGGALSLPGRTAPSDPVATARFSAVAAHAARILRDLPDALGREGRAVEERRLTRAASLAWSYARKTAPPVERCRAAGELYDLLGVEALRSHLVPDGVLPTESLLGWARAGRVPGVADRLRAQAREGVHRRLRELHAGGGHRDTLHDSEALAAAVALLLLPASPDVDDASSARELLGLELDAALGANAIGASRITGLGSQAPRHATLPGAPSRPPATAVSPAGLPVGRPTRSPGPSTALLAMFHPPLASWPPGLAWADVREIRAWSAAPLVGGHAALVVRLVALAAEPPTAAPIASDTWTLAAAPAAKVTGLGRGRSARAKAAGVVTLQQLAAADPRRVDVPADAVAHASDVLALAAGISVPDAVAGLRVAQILALPPHDDPAVEHLRTTLTVLAARLERRWFLRLRAVRLRASNEGRPR